MRIIFIIITSLCIFAYGAFGQADTSFKRYNLTHPQPRAKLKKMQTDRPGATESPFTVAAGHLQIETDLFKQVRNRDQQLLSVESSYNLVNLKLGLTQRTAVQVLIPTFVSKITREIDTRKITEKQEGFGDIIVRYKYNVWGYDGGKTALALLPFLSLPTASSGNTDVKGGILIPFARAISKRWHLGSQLGYTLAKEDDNAYHSSYEYSFNLARSVRKTVDVFTEIQIDYGMYQQRFEPYVNGGIILSLSDNLHLDAGFNYGIKTGSDRGFFTGLSLRL